MNIVNCGYDYHHSQGFRIHRPHGSGDYILLIVRSPAAFYFDGITHVTKGNAVVLFNKGTPQIYGSHNAEYINDWIHFECDEDDVAFLARLGIAFDTVMEFPNVNVLSSLIKQMYFERYLRQLLDARVSQKSTESMDYLTRLILIEIYSNSNPPVVSHTAEKIAAWIKANCHTSITETQIAKQFGYNPDYLNRLFKSSYSKTIKQYINEKRMEHIKGLMLGNDLTLKEIAYRSGFTEYKYFLKFFKYHEHVTPTEFYKLYAKMHINSR